MTVSGERMKSFVERIEKLEEERAALGGDMRDVYAEAKGTGFDTKIMRQVIRLRKMEPAERAEMDELLDLYKQAIGMAGGSGLYAGGVQEAADRFNAGKTVQQVADELGLSKSEAGKLRQRCEAAGLLTVERGRGRPRKEASEKVSGISEGETNPTPEKVSRKNSVHDTPTTTPSPTPMEAPGGVAQNAAIGLRDGAAQAGNHEPQSQQPPANFETEDLSQDGAGIEAEVPQPEPDAERSVARPAMSAELERNARRLFQGGKVTVEFGGKTYGPGNVDEFREDLPAFLNRALQAARPA